MVIPCDFLKNQWEYENKQYTIVKHFQIATKNKDDISNFLKK